MHHKNILFIISTSMEKNALVWDIEGDMNK